MARAQGDRQDLRNQVEVQRREDSRLLGSTPRVLIERGIVVLDAGILDAGAGERADIREAAGIARRARQAVRGARRYGLVLPTGAVEEFVVLVVRADDAAQAPLIRRAQTNFVLHMLIALGRSPRSARREAGRRERVGGGSRAVALIVVRIMATRVVRVVADLVDVTHEVAAGVDRPYGTELAVDRPRRVLELILVESRIEQRDFERRQRHAVRGVGRLVEHPLRIHVLVHLREQHIPVVIDLEQSLRADPLVRDGIAGPAHDAVVVDGRGVRRHAARVVRIANADVGRLARKGSRHIVDVAAAPVVKYHGAHRQGVGDQRDVQHRRQVGVRVAVSGDSVAGIDVAFGHIELRLVRDIADRAGLGAGAEQRALRTFQNLDAFEVGRIDVEVAIWQLTGLIIQVDRDVRK